jgi:hypothetical protein
LLKKVSAEYTKEKWQNCRSHVKSYKVNTGNEGGLMDEANDSMIITDRLYKYR